MSEDESDNAGNGKVIRASLGTLDVEVHGDDMDETEAVFKRVWEKRLKEAEEASKALRDGDRSVA